MRRQPSGGSIPCRERGGIVITAAIALALGGAVYYFLGSTPIAIIAAVAALFVTDEVEPSSWWDNLSWGPGRSRDPDSESSGPSWIVRIGCRKGRTEDE